MTRRVAALALAILAMVQAPGRASPFDPTSDYESRDLHGFRVLLNRRLREDPAEAAEALAELEAQLGRVARVVPPAKLDRLRGVRFWVERSARPGGAAEFHPSAAWLRDHGYNPEKAGGIEIGNARNFVAWSRRHQPWMVLHELAHAYHYLVLGGDDPAVRAAYRHAMGRGLYARVRTADGPEREAYATTDEKEYFAELSEAYFGRNDFAPFTREELKAFDPEGYRLMEVAWGEPLAKAPGP